MAALVVAVITGFILEESWIAFIFADGLLIALWLVGIQMWQDAQGEASRVNQRAQSGR